MQAVSARMENSTDPVELRRLAAVALAIGVLAQIALPLIHGYGRTVVTIASVVSLFAAAALHSLAESGMALILSLAVFFLGGLVVETIGVRTGVPFGSYDYTGGLGLKILGVPLVVPMAWMMMGWPAFVAGRKVGNAPVVGAAILVTWDLLLDPQMVKAGYWRWNASSWPRLNDIPLSNTLGWIVVAAAMMSAMEYLLNIELDSDGLPLLVLAWTWFGSIAGALVFGLSKPAVGVVGGVALTLALTPVALRVINDFKAHQPAPRPGAAPPRTSAGGGRPSRTE